MNLGDKIRFYRKQNHMTQENLAKEAGVSIQAVSGWERGKYIPEGKKLFQIANILHVSTENLVCEDDFIMQTGKSELFEESSLIRHTNEKMEEYGLDQTRKILTFLRNEKNKQIREMALLRVNDALSMKIKDEVILSSLMMIDAEQNIGRMQGGKEIRNILFMVNGLFGDIDDEEKNVRYAAIISDEKASVVLLFHMMTLLCNMARYYDRGKMIKIIKDADQYLVPLLDNLESKKYENIRFPVRYRMTSMIDTIKRII